VVSDKYTSQSQYEIQRVFLAGDAAHAYPPSGGYGMNTGIGDVFNLAHKLSVGLSAETASEYDNERRLIGKVTNDFALINYHKSCTIAKKLGLDPFHA
jgi:2-polyprenyl-6-methoxyphenol hydroxylase-like FAD-dependent oxidoreductase